MNETTEKCSHPRYARTILKVAIFLVKSDIVSRHGKVGKFQKRLLVTPKYWGLIAWRGLFLWAAWLRGWQGYVGRSVALFHPQRKAGGPWRMMVPIWPPPWTFEAMGGHLSFVKGSTGSYFKGKMEKVKISQGNDSSKQLYCFSSIFQNIF